MKRFIKSKEGIVCDQKTGLEWQAEPLPPAPWQEQMDRAAALNLGGYADWRLPTIEELITLIDYTMVAPASEFPSTPNSWFWSSSSRAASASYAWYVHFNDGNVGYVDKTNDFYARCVRSK